MRIGYFISHFPYNRPGDETLSGRYTYGGAEKVAFSLAVKMAKSGHDVIVFTSSVDSKNSHESHQPFEICRYGTVFRIARGNFSPLLLLGPLKYQIDIAHIHFTNPPGDLAGLLHGKTRKTPLIVTYHGDGVAEYGNLLRRMIVTFHNRYMVSEVLANARVIISPSNNYINESQFLPKYREKIITIPNGIDEDEYKAHCSKVACRVRLGLPTDEKVVLFVGNFVKYKGIDVLLRCMPEVAKIVPKVRLVMVGSGNIKQDLEKLARFLRIDKHVTFTGFVSENRKILYYRSSDVFVLPSTMGPECFPTVILEAMACGLPIVASNISGIPELVRHCENGFLIPPRNVGALSTSLIDLLTNEDLPTKMAKNSIRMVKRYSWENIVRKTEEVYRQVLADRPSKI